MATVLRLVGGGLRAHKTSLRFRTDETLGIEMQEVWGLPFLIHMQIRGGVGRARRVWFVSGPGFGCAVLGPARRKVWRCLLGGNMRKFFRRPSHATVVAYLALFVAMSGTAVAATGGTVILGKINRSSDTTTIRSFFDTPLSLKAGGLQPPLEVNSSQKVWALNADLIDGLDSSSFQRSLGDSFVVSISTCPRETTFQTNITLKHTYGGDHLYVLCRVD